MANTDAEALAKTPKGQRHISFFSLAPELRNIIMHYILVPGSVHLRRPENQYRRTSGFQFLATCRQAYEEGHTMFYSLNNFFMVPGSLEHTLEYFEILRPNHQALIQTFGIEFSLEDADATMLAEIDKRFEGYLSEYSARKRQNERRWGFWSSSLHGPISRVLKSKIGWLRNWHTPPRAVMLQSHGITMMLASASDKIAEIVKDSHGFVDYSENRCISVNILLKTVITNFEREICRVIQEEGWDGFKDWLEEGRRSDPGRLALRMPSCVF